MKQTSNVIVTGVNGFVGPHLAKELLNRGCSVIGLGHGPNTLPELEDTITYQSHDLTDQSATDALDFAAADAVIHLAGLSSQAQSFDQPQRFISSNSAMLINLFESALKQKPAKLPRFVVISSGAVYDSNQSMPLNEKSLTANNSPYVISKLLLEHLCAYYQTRGFECVVARPFNHTGPGQGPGFLIPDLTRQIVSAGRQGTVTVGNLKTRRDYSDVRDIVRAYADLALTDNIESGVFNLSSGVSHSGEEVLKLVAKAAFGEDHQLSISVDQTKIRPNDPPEIFGDNGKIRAATGWTPQINLETTINDYVAWAKQNL